MYDPKQGKGVYANPLIGQNPNVTLTEPKSLVYFLSDTALAPYAKMNKNKNWEQFPNGSSWFGSNDETSKLELSV